MASQPRAARKGKAAAPVTPQGTATTPPSMASPMSLPDANTSASIGSPAGTSDSSAVTPSTPSFLSTGSLLQLNNDATSHVAMGVVRGRGQAQLASDLPVVAKPEDVSTAVTAALKTSVSAKAKDAPKLTALPTTKATGVFLVKEANVLQRASLLSQAHDENVVLFVSPHPADVDEADLNGLAQKQVATWYGNTTGMNQQTKLVLADLATAQLHLTTNKTLNPFTHVVLSHTASSVILYQSVLFMIRMYFTATVGRKPKLYIATYAEGQDISLKAYFEAFTVEAEGPTSVGSCEVTRFSADECAAFSGVACLKPGRIVEDRSITGAMVPIPQPKVMDRVHQQALAIIRKLVAEKSAGDASGGLRIVYFTADAPMVQSQLVKDCPEGVEVVAGIDAFTATAGSKTHQVAFESKLSPAVNVSGLDVHVVIDSALERVVHIASKAEQMLPSKRAEWCAREATIARERVLGQRRPGLYFNLQTEEDAKLGGSMIADPTPMCSAEHALLQLARFMNTDAIEVMQKGPTRPTLDALESALTHLNEKNAIASATQPNITFLGEVMARSGLGLDLASFMANGLICGMSQLFAVTAAVIVASIRQIPKTTDPKTQEAWLLKANTQMKAIGGAKNSDVLADVLSYLKCLQGGDAAAKEEGVEAAQVARVTQVADLVQKRLRDFIVPSPVLTPAQLTQLVESRGNEIEFILAASLARNALSVRSEGAITGKPATGNLLFLRTTKEVQGNTFAPSSMSWRSGTVVIPTSLNNTAHKIFAQGGSLLHQNYFFTSLVLLTPTLDYSSPMEHKEEQVICFSVTVNKNAKRFYTDVGTAARILEFREQWNALLGAVQVKRSLPNKTSRIQILSTLQAKLTKFDLDATRLKALDEFSQLVQNCEMKEFQSVFEAHGQHRTVPSTEIKMERIAEPSDVAVSQAIAAGNLNGGVEDTAATSAAGGSAVPKPIEQVGASKDAAFEGLGNGAVVVEEDDDIEVEGQGFFASGAVIEEDDDE